MSVDSQEVSENVTSLLVSTSVLMVEMVAQILKNLNFLALSVSHPHE
jgi:hypothetical protein